MALYDYLPVALFCLGGAYLIKDFYNKMYKGVFSLLSMGIFTVGSAGFFKATWKLLYNSGICDFEVLNKCFFPMQTLGFFYMALAMLFFSLTGYKRDFREKVYCSTSVLLPLAMLTPAPKYTSNMPFVIIMSISALILYILLVRVSILHKNTISAVLYVISFIFVMVMGHLSSKNFEQAYMNWIAQTVNTIAQGTFFLAARINHKSGLDKYDALIKSKEE